MIEDLMPEHETGVEVIIEDVIKNKSKNYILSPSSGK